MGKIALLLALALLAGPARAEDSLRVGLSSQACFCFVPLPVGEAAGIWARHGLKIQQFALQGDAQLQQGLAAGSIDIGLGSGPGMGFLAKGVPAKAVAAIAGPPADMALYVLANSPVTEPAGLKGARIAVSSPGSLTYWLVRRLADSQGWKLTDLTPVSLGNTGSMLAGARSGAVGAVMGGLETALALSNSHEGRLLATMDKMVPHFLAHVMFATDALIADHPDTLRRFLAGWFDTVAYIDTHPAETENAVTDAWKWQPGVSTQSQALVMAAMSRDGRFDPSALTEVEQSLVDLAILPTKPDLARAIDTRFLP